MALLLSDELVSRRQTSLSEICLTIFDADSVPLQVDIITNSRVMATSTCLSHDELDAGLVQRWMPAFAETWFSFILCLSRHPCCVIGESVLSLFSKDIHLSRLDWYKGGHICAAWLTHKATLPLSLICCSHISTFHQLLADHFKLRRIQWVHWIDQRKDWVFLFFLRVERWNTFFTSSVSRGIFATFWST